MKDEKAINNLNNKKNPGASFLTFKKSENTQFNIHFSFSFNFSSLFFLAYLF
jgi:hypothetical protein